MDAIGPLPYTTMNSMLDGGYPRGALNYWKSNFLASLSDEAIRTMIDCFAQCPSPMGQLLLEHFHGAITRVGVTDTAFPLRAEGYNLLVLSQWIGCERQRRMYCLGAEFVHRNAAFHGFRALHELSGRR